MITYEEVGRLLGLAAARDQRTVGDADNLAWHADLNAARITYTDAEAAITRFYAIDMASLNPDQRRRITTPDIISTARKIRRDRLENFVYEGDPDETPQQYLARLRSQIAAVASGRTPPPTERPALEGAPHRSINELLSTVGEAIPNTEEPTPPRETRGPLGITCPDCLAPIGRPCRGRLGRRAPHPARRRAAAGEPIRHDTPEQIEARRQASIAYLANLNNEASDA